MSAETRLREAICVTAASMYARGLTHGSTGNISARLPDGGLLITPTGSSFGGLDPARLSRLDAEGPLVAGDPPTKEMPLHGAFYPTRGARAGAVVHLHATHSVGLSVLPDVDPDCVLPPLTACAVMRLGRVRLLPYFRPGDPAIGEAVHALAGAHAAVLLAHHGPVVAGATLETAAKATEELEATARLVLLTRGQAPRRLSAAQIDDICRHVGTEW